MQVIVDQLLTTYTKTGSGSRTVLFLHGWADSAQTFIALADALHKESDAYTAICLDLPGFGGTQMPKSAWGIPDYAAFVASFLKKLKLEPAVIVGHSNGGAIAIHGVSQGVFKTEALILIGSAGIRNKSVKKSVLRMLSAPAKIAIKATPQATQKRVKKRLYNAIGSDYLIAENMQETFKKIVAYDVQQEAAQLTVPTCLIYGHDDAATPVSYGKQYNKIIPGSKLTVVPLTGHFVHQEQAYKVATTITNFLTETQR